MGLNLHGHPLAGIFWETFCQEKLFNAGFEKIQGCECLYAHYEKQLFLSVHVDDFKMSGKKENFSPMWAELGKELDLEPPVPMSCNVYLGCQQLDFEPSWEVIDE